MTNSDFWDSIQSIISDGFNPGGLSKLEEYAAMKTKNIDRRSISQIANAGKGNGDAKAEKKSESSNAGGKSSKKVDKNNAEADKKSISGYAHMLNRHDD